MFGSMLVEPLKAKGLPVALCDLVASMLDCANSDIGSDESTCESYCNMSEVRDDLQLMLDKPSTYLYEGLSSTTELQLLGGTLFGRNSELNSLLCLMTLLAEQILLLLVQAASPLVAAFVGAWVLHMWPLIRVRDLILAR